jgi:hypothetical protein
MADEEDAARGTLNGDLLGNDCGAIANRRAGLRGGPHALVQANDGKGGFLLVREPDCGAPLAAGDSGGRRRVHASGDVNCVERDATAREAGFEGERYGEIAGIDYTTALRLIAGIAGNYARDDYVLAANGGTIESGS